MQAIALMDTVVLGKEVGGWKGVFCFHLSIASTAVHGNDALSLVLKLKSLPKLEGPNIYQNFAKCS